MVSFSCAFYIVDLEFPEHKNTSGKLHTDETVCNDTWCAYLIDLSLEVSINWAYIALL